MPTPWSAVWKSKNRSASTMSIKINLESNSYMPLLKKAMTMCQRNTERLLVLDRAKAVRIPETLRFLTPYMDQPLFAERACLSVVELAHHRGLREPNKAEFHRALEEIFRFTDRANRYLDSQAPWKAAKQSDGRAVVERCLYATCEALRVTALLLAAFLPESAASLLKRLGLEDALATARLPDDARRWGVIPPGTQVEAGAPLFPRLEAPSEAGT